MIGMRLSFRLLSQFRPTGLISNKFASTPREQYVAGLVYPLCILQSKQCDSSFHLAATVLPSHSSLAMLHCTAAFPSDKNFRHSPRLPLPCRFAKTTAHCWWCLPCHGYRSHRAHHTRYLTKERKPWKAGRAPTAYGALPSSPQVSNQPCTSTVLEQGTPSRQRSLNMSTPSTIRLSNCNKQILMICSYRISDCHARGPWLAADNRAPKKKKPKHLPKKPFAGLLATVVWLEHRSFRTRHAICLTYAMGGAAPKIALNKCAASCTPNGHR